MRLRLRIAIVLTLIASLLSVPAAAEVHHPRQQWMRSATAGLFLHWGMLTYPKQYNCAEWENSVTSGGWTPDYWVDEARKLGASYIVLATFHSGLGYARPWPSKIPGSCAPKRDFLGEVVKAGKAKGVKLVLYMTDDPQWHGPSSFDSAAYSAYKGKQVDLRTRDGFGMYSFDLFHEVMDNYPDLGGFWIDNDNEYWERNGLYEQIRQKRPSYTLTNNNEDTPIMDVVSNESKTGMTPPYDYPQGVYTPMPRIVEACYKMTTGGTWSYDGVDFPIDIGLNIGRYITNAGSSIKSLMAETPMKNGRMPPTQEAFNNLMESWTKPIRKSLQGTEGGGYLYGGMQPGLWNDGAHGVITVEPGAKTQYVHVVTRPRTDFVRLRDNGYQVTGVSDVRTGKRLRFTQSGGHLSILDIKEWDQYDTVFKVETVGQHYYHSGVTASASSSLEGFPASNLTDGSFEKYWDSNASVPVSITLDLGSRRQATSLAINQREASPTHARVSFGRYEDSARIKDFRVHASVDGKRWEQIRAGTLPSARGVQFIDVGEQLTRYLKLEVLDTWSGAQAQNFARKLWIDEIKVARGNPFLHPSALPLEAESASLDGTARRDLCRACSGSFQVVGLGGGPRNSVTYQDIRVSEAGDYRLQLDTTTSGALAVSVNSAAPISVPAAADRPDVPASSEVVVKLRAGVNTVKLFSDAPKGVDRVSVSPLPAESHVPVTTLTVHPHGVQWVGPGQQSVEVSARLRLDVDEQLDQVRLAPTVPAGWTVKGDAVTAASMRLGQSIDGRWTLTSPPGQDVGAITGAMTASFQVLGRAKEVSRPLPVRTMPADRVFMREAEDTRNRLGPAGVGIRDCAACSGGQTIRNISSAADAYLLFENVVVDTAREHTLFIDYTNNGEGSFFVTVNGATPVQVKLVSDPAEIPYTAAIPVQLKAGANTIRIHNEAPPKPGGPNVDRISLK